jgi:hypothetical protein
MPRVHCLPRDKHDSVLGAVKRHSKGDAGADGGFDGSGIAAEAIRTHTRGIGHLGRSRGGELACTGRHWSASLIHLQRARPCRPVPFFVAIGDSRSASRPPIAFAVARFDVIPAKAGIRPSIEVSVNCGPGQIPACAGMTEFGR